MSFTITNELPQIKVAANRAILASVFIFLAFLLLCIFILTFLLCNIINISENHLIHHIIIANCLAKHNENNAKNMCIIMKCFPALEGFMFSLIFVARLRI